MTQTRLALSGALALAILTGCASQPDPNLAACTGFEQLHNEWASIEWDSNVSADDRLSFRRDYRDSVDKIALASAGHVKDRLNAVVEVLPADLTELLLTSSGEAYSAYTSAAALVVNACDAARAPIALDAVQ